MKRIFKEISPVRSDPVLNDLKHSMNITLQQKVSYGQLIPDVFNQKSSKMVNSPIKKNQHLENNDTLFSDICPINRKI